jgi:hypothetical protein
MKMSALAVAGSVALLTACGGGSGNNDTPDPIVEDTSTEALKASASRNIGGSLDSALDGVSRVTSGGDSSDGFSENPENTGIGGLWDDDARSLISTSLDLGNDENTVREGSRITIDPDDAEVCREELVGMDSTDAEFQRCQALVADMLVQIDASSDTDGRLTYLFREQPLAVLGYSPDSNSFELNMGTMKTLLEAEALLDPDPDLSSPLDTIRGALRLTATATNQTSGAEAGSVSLQVSQPLEIASADATTSLSLGAGTVLSMSADAAAESVAIDIGWGALQLTAPDEDGLVTSLDMRGLSVSIDLSEDDDQLTVSNVGIGQGPLRIALDNAEVLNMGLDTFGFTVSATDGSITLDGALDFSLLVRQVLEDDTVSDTLFELLELTAPAGTQFRDEFGVLLVDGGGPVQYSLTSQDDTGITVVDQLTVFAGQCADDVGDFESDVELVDCQ